jgi:tetratricopeptide (TPR) repeat protein
VARTTLPLLSALLDKSLLRKGPTGRYEILEILRQYAEEKLDASPGEKEGITDRHCKFYAGFLQEREEALRSERQREALEEIGVEIENLREAWTQAIRQRKLESLTRGLEGLYRFYDIQSWFREGEEAFARASEGLSEASGEAQLLRAKLLSRRSAFAVRLSRYEEARDLARQSLEIFQHAGDRKESAFAQNNLGNIAHNLGAYPEAGKRYEESLALSREEGDPIKEASVLNNLGIVSSALGEFAAARERFQRSLQIYRGTGDRRGIAAALVNLGSLAFDQGAPGEARPLYQESLEAFRELGDRRGIALALTSLGRVAFALSEAEEAKRLYEEGLALRRELGDRLGTIHTLVNLGNVSTSLGQTAEARAYLAEASRKTQEIRALPLAADILLAAARLFLKEETPVRADQRARACQYLALVADHSAATRETRENARTLLADAETSLPSGTDPSFRAGPRTLEQALEELLNDDRVEP